MCGLTSIYQKINLNMDRYQKALADSHVADNDQVVAEAVAKILEKAPQYANAETYRFLLNSIDLTTLSSEDSVESVSKFTSRVNDFDNDYPQYGNVAAICVYSNFAEVVRANLDVAGVDVAVVAGCFPSAQTFLPVKIADCSLAVASGADEVDIVFPLGLYRDQNYEDLCDELIEMKHAVRDAKLKVILETGALKTAADIKKASILSLWSEADFLKTSTGKMYPGASLEAAYVMCQCIKEYFDLTGRKVGFKASGGIRTSEDALAYYTVVREVLGEEWLNHSLFRIGASSLANSLLSTLEGTETKYF